MKIALDFDDTFTRSPLLWLCFIKEAEITGSEVRIVTARDRDNDGIDWTKVGLAKAPVPVVWCDGRPKREVCREIGWEPDVWIDDNPAGIILTSSFGSEEDLLAWRLQDELGTRKLPIHGRSRGLRKEPKDGGAPSPRTRLQQRRDA